jgi:hypothetical protein
MSTPRIALATCMTFPELDEDDAPLLPALKERGVEAVAAVWDDPDVDWAGFELVVIRDTWDYSPRREQFLTWARSLSAVANPASVLEWNTDKGYLRDLEAAGLPTVPTIWLDPARNLTSRAVHTRFPAIGDFVVKPTVSAGAKDTGRYDANEAEQRGLAIVHARDLLRAGRHVMVQPYLSRVDTAGETALVYVDGEFSHAVRKGPLLEGPYRGVEGLFKQEEMAAREATPAERAVGDRVVEALPTIVPGAEDGPLLYTRVDLLQGEQGDPVVLEVELTEPSLFLSLSEGALDRFADAISRRVGA